MAEAQQKDNKATPPTLLLEFADDVIVLVHSSRAPEKADWKKYLDAAFRTCKHFGRAKVLVSTPGASPNATQRAEVISLAKDYPVPMAVCTESRIARGVIQAMSWASHMNIKAFRSEDWAGACGHLGIAPERAAFFGGIVQRLQAELGEPSGTFRTGR